MGRKRSSERFRTIKAPEGFHIVEWKYLDKGLTGLRPKSIRIFFRKDA